MELHKSLLFIMHVWLGQASVEPFTASHNLHPSLISLYPWIRCLVFVLFSLQHICILNDQAKEKYSVWWQEKGLLPVKTWLQRDHFHRFCFNLFTCVYIYLYTSTSLGRKNISLSYSNLFCSVRCQSFWTSLCYHEFVLSCKMKGNTNKCHKMTSECAIFSSCCKGYSCYNRESL